MSAECQGQSYLNDVNFVSMFSDFLGIFALVWAIAIEFFWTNLSNDHRLSDWCHGLEFDFNQENSLVQCARLLIDFHLAIISTIDSKLPKQCKMQLNQIQGMIWLGLKRFFFF